MQVLHFISFQDGLVGVRVGFLHPGEQSGAKVETDVSVVVDDFCDEAFFVEDTGSRVGCVALEIDALVPVVKRGGAVLQFNGFDPGTFTGRLVKMAMNADVFILTHGAFD